MATRTSKTASASQPARRVGRPTNAERQQSVASQQSQLIDMAVAAASAAIKSVMGIAGDGGVQTIGIPQGTQSQSASTGTASTSQTASGNQTAGTSPAAKTGTRTRQAPGRRVDATSKMSQTKVFYDENLKAPNPLNRADFVRAAAEKFGYSVQTANTYVSNIEKVGGYKMVRRGGTNAARGGRSRGTGGNDNGQKTANAA